ncbi:unnamed protein product, partial [Prorocentrum cordatum]
AAGIARDKCAPTDQQQRAVIKAFDMNRKAIYEFGSAVEASDFISDFLGVENMTYRGPEGNGELFSLKVLRDWGVNGRRLFLAMEKVRQKLDALLLGRFPAGSNGLGGDARVLRSAENPGRVARLAVLEGSGDVNLDLQQTSFDEFGIGAEAAAPLGADIA